MTNSGNHMKIGTYKNPLKLLKQAAFIALLSLLTQTVLAASLTVKTDRQTVEMGDVITLIIAADFQVNEELNLDKLKDQFEVLNQQQSNQVQIVNGKYDSFTRWRVQVLPKQIGNLVVPPFTVKGVSSDPYPIEVKRAQYSDDNRPYFLEAQVDKTTAYVQEQVLYTLRFFHKGSLINGNIRPPKFEDALVEQIKEQSVYGKSINGQQYTVYEWQYAFFPQTSGQIGIAAPSFTGLVQLRGGQKGVRALAKNITVKVLPQKTKSGSYWLPAEDFKITQKWDNIPQTVHVGDSLRRVITIEAKGLKASQLPDLTTPNGQGYKIYTDSKKPTQIMNSSGIIGKIEISQAVVPTTEGSLQIPDVAIQWWNTQTDKLETAVLKTDAIKVWPANSSIPTVVQTNQNQLDRIDQQQRSDSAKAAQDSMMANWYWPVAVVVLIILLLITTLLLVRSQSKLKQLSNKVNNQNTITESNIEKVTFDQSWCDLPLNEFYAEMLRKLRTEFGITDINAIPNPLLIDAIRDLEGHLFGEQKLGYKTMQAICDNWAALVNRHNKSQEPDKKKDLVSLYNK